MYLLLCITYTDIRHRKIHQKLICQSYWHTSTCSSIWMFVQAIHRSESFWYTFLLAILVFFQFLQKWIITILYHLYKLEHTNSTSRLVTCNIVLQNTCNYHHHTTTNKIHCCKTKQPASTPSLNPDNNYWNQTASQTNTKQLQPPPTTPSLPPIKPSVESIFEG